MAQRAKLALLGGLAGICQAVGSGPILAKQWSANVTTSQWQGEQSQSSVTPYYYDGVNMRYRTITVRVVDLFHPNDTIHKDMLATKGPGLNVNMTIGVGDDAVCKAMTQPYNDPFAALEAAGTMNGTGNVSGQPCQIWVGRTFASPYEIEVSACVGNQGVPLEMNQTYVMGGHEMGGSRMVWSDTKIGPPPEDVFKVSKACATNYPTKPCASDGTTILDLYRIHSPAEPFALDNRNVGDALGDMAFTCGTGGSGLSGSSNSVVSRWSVEVSEAFGQYGYCLYNRSNHENYCYGGTGHQVGRESAMGLGAGSLQGQCSSNFDVGNWYSFPAGGKCPEGQPIGTNGCTWANARKLRTVNASCIMKDRGLQQTCITEQGHAPFLKSEAIFKAALATDDVSMGGCPDAFPATLWV